MNLMPDNRSAMISVVFEPLERNCRCRDAVRSLVSGSSRLPVSVQRHFAECCWQILEPTL